MHRMIVLVITAYLVFLQCSVSPESVNIEKPVFENAVTLALRFGDDDRSLPSEFLVARPRALGVSKNNEILLIDENRIKVYDQDGKPVRIVGSPGQGPGEFESASGLHIGPSGFISVKNTSSISLFSPDLEFINQIRYTNSASFKQLKKENNWQSGLALYAVFFGADEKVVLVNGIEYPENEVSKMTNKSYVLAHEKNGISYTVAEYKQEYNSMIMMQATAVSYNLQFFGSFLWSILPGNKVVYINTGSDFDKSDTGSYYKLNLLSLDTKSKEILERTYDPVKIEDDMLPEIESEQMEEIEGFDKRTYENFMDDMYDFRDNMVHCAPLQALRVDGNYLFAFTYKKNDKNEIFTDVFDIGSMEHISSLYFPNIPRAIANGFAYRIEREDKDSFFTIAKYKINPEVYNRKTVLKNN